MLSRPFSLWLSLVIALTAAGLAVAYLTESVYSWIVVGLTMVAIAAATHALLKTNPLYHFYRRTPPTVYAWIPPLLLAFAGIAFVKQILGGAFAWAGIAGTIVGVTILVICQYALAEEDHPLRGLARAVSNLLLYLATFVVIVALQTTDTGLARLSTLIGAFCGVTAFHLLHDLRERPARTIAFGVAIGVLMAELSWSLNFLSLGKFYSGIALVIPFYIMVGIVHSYMQQHFTQWVALEFVGVGAVSFFFIYTFRILGA